MSNLSIEMIVSEIPYAVLLPEFDSPGFRCGQQRSGGTVAAGTDRLTPRPSMITACSVTQTLFNFVVGHAITAVYISMVTMQGMRSCQ